METTSLQKKNSMEYKQSIPEDSIGGSFRWVAMIEIVVFYSLLLLIDIAVLNGDRFSSLSPHPFWIPVILISTQYGTRMGLISVIAATCLLLIGNMPERSLEQDLHQWYYSIYKMPLLWLISAVIVGELSQRHINAKRKSKEELLESLKRESKIKESYHALNAKKELLEVRAAGQWLTINSVLNVVKSMNYFDRDQLLANSLELVQVVLEPEALSIYVHKDHSLCLNHCVGWEESDEYDQELNRNSPIYRSIVAERKILVVSDPLDEIALDGHGILAAPLVIPDSGELIGMIKIERIRFKKLSKNTINNFRSLAEWIGAIYAKSHKLVTVPVSS